MPVGKEKSSTSTCPLGRRTRAISRIAAGQSAMLRKPKATVTTSKLASGNGRSSASATIVWRVLSARRQPASRAKNPRRDLRLRHLPLHRQSEIAAAGRKIEHSPRLPLPNDFRSSMAPPEIQAAAQEMIGDIVAARDPLKHGADRGRVSIGCARVRHGRRAYSRTGSLRSSSGALSLFFATMRAQVFQRKSASSLPDGRIFSAVSNCRIASQSS